MIAQAAIRLAIPGDAAAIASLSRDLIEHGLPWTWHPARVAAAIAAAHTNVAVVGPPGRPTAFGIMEYLDDDAHLVLLAVAQRRQRRGLGSALLRWLESAACTAGAVRIRVEARRENAAARHFYNEHGYHERSLVPAMYSGVVDGVRLEKWLREPEPGAPP